MGFTVWGFTVWGSQFGGQTQQRQAVEGLLPTSPPRTDDVSAGLSLATPWPHFDRKKAKPLFEETNVLDVAEISSHWTGNQSFSFSFIFIFVCFLETGSGIAQDGLELSTQLQVALNSGPSCLHLLKQWLSTWGLWPL